MENELRLTKSDRLPQVRGIREVKTRNFQDFVQS